MRSLPVNEKYALIKRARAGEKVSRLCREAGISRKTFYLWLKKANSTRPNLVHLAMADRRCKAPRRPKKIDVKDKLLYVNKCLNKETSVAGLCRQVGVSRKTFYEWLESYERKGEEGLWERRPSGYDHHRAVSEEAEGKLLAYVAANPQLSVHELARRLDFIGHHGIQNVLERRDLRNIESRLQFAQGYEGEVTKKVKLSPLYWPQVCLYRLRQIIAPFKTIPKLSWLFQRGWLLTLGIFLAGFYFYQVGWAIIFSPTGTFLGTFFAAVSLTFGLFFLFYSLKYYVSMILVLKLAQSGSLDPSIAKTERLEDRRSGLGRLFATMLNVGGFARAHELRTNHLSVNLDKVDLKGKAPFVSVHIACYNEKRVIARLLAACTAQDWATLIEPINTDYTDSVKSASTQSNQRVGVANYEVVIADDSKDETTEIILQYLRDNYAKLRIVKDDEAEQIYKAVPKTPDQPSFTLIHRNNRSGFKGGALQRALLNTDKRAQYITVFDADFVPYPDTIEQFVKTFQVLNANDMRMENARMDANISKNSHNSNSPTNSPVIAAVQGYQWHVLNKSENWVTRGVRTEYAGSYVVERCGEEIYGGLKQIAGSVYMIRADVLREFGWGRSITEDFELTLKLYEAGYKVAFTPYIQAPAEAVSTLKRLIRQRMRWAEGASFNIKIMLPRVFKSQRITGAEKFEFAYLAPYYLQAVFFVVGTASWFIAEAILGSRLPFWTAALGWSLVFTNLLALPLMNIIGLFLEESQERDYVGILSFLALSYIVVPFQAYAAIKGFFEEEEGPWFRTPKTGTITDTFGRSHFNKFFGNIFGGRPAGAPIMPIGADLTDSAKSVLIGWNQRLASASAFNPLGRGREMALAFRNPLRPRHFRLAGNLALGIVIAITVSMSVVAPFVPQTSIYAQTPQVKTLGQPSGEEEADEEEPASAGEEITKSRYIRKETGDGRSIEYIFERDPIVRVKIDGYEIEFETKEIGGHEVNARVAKIYGEKQVVYEEAAAGIDIKYTVNEGLITEEFILKTAKAAEVVGDKITQNIRTVGVKVVSPDPTAFGFYPSTCPSTMSSGPNGSGQAQSCEELFRLSQPFAKDDDGSVTNDISFSLEKDYIGYRLTKTIGSSAQEWFKDAIRAYPVSIDPTIVTGGVDSDEVTYGGLQRKLAYVNSNWYAFYSCDANPCTSGGTTGKVYYQKSSNGTSWGGYVDMDSTDTDNYNPSISVSGTTIIVFWVDDGANLAEGKTITTGADTLGTLCQTGSEATADPSFMVTVAAVSATQAVVAISDTAADTDFGVYVPDTLDGTCANATTARETGNISLGSGLTGGDRPVVVPLSSTKVAMVFQDGDLSYSELNIIGTGGADSEWTTNNLQIANVADNIYSVTTDAAATPKVWILTASASDTNFYTCCTTDFTNVQIDSDTGANGDDADDDINMYCFAADDCKIVYTDDRDDATAPNLIYVDCGDETCTSGNRTVTTLDADYGDAGDTPGADIYCVATDNCKVAYFDLLDTGGPDFIFVDCNDAACSSPTLGTIDGDAGSGTSTATISIDCTGGDTDCKVLYNDGQSADLDFVDCSAADCSTRDAITTFDTATGIEPKGDMTCVTGATDCKIVYHDTNATSGCADVDSICFVDCGAAACTSTAQTVFDADVSGTTGQVPSAIWCPALDGADCRVAYGDGQDTNMYFVDCGSTSCGSSTITTVDSTGGSDASNDPTVSMDCISVTDCKVTYVADLTSTAEKLYFLNCDSNACSSGDEVIEIPGAPRFAAAVDCPTTGNCKTVVVDGGTGSPPTVEFYDCANADGDCFPSVTSNTAPWESAQTEVETVTLTYNSGNSSLYASVIKDSSDQAYYKSTPVASISWTPADPGTSWNFTAGALNEISSPETVTAETQVSVVLNRTDTDGNFEFANVPERTFFLLVPLGYLAWKRRKRGRGP